MIKKDKRSAIDKEVDRCLEGMSLVADQTSDDYKKRMNVLCNLVDIKVKKEPRKDDRNKINWNTIASVVGNLTGIGLIMNFERLNTFTTKALSFVIKPKI